MDAATELVAAEMGGLLVLNGDGEGFEFFKVSGWPYEPHGFPSGAGILGLAYRQRKPVRLDEVHCHPQAIGFPAYHPEISAFLSVPLLGKRHALGALFVSNAPGGRTFSADNEELLLAFAAQATIAIENARLYTHAEELARLCERQRIAQALHDTLAQILFTIGLEAEWCVDHLAADGQLRQKLQTIRRLAARCSSELRCAIFALRSRYLTSNDSLIELLREQVAEFEAQSGIPATLIVPPQQPTLPPMVGEAVYRIVCESLSNVGKHARASAVVVSLNSDGDSVTATIQDNGVGLPEPLALGLDDSDLHFGVATMRQLTEQAQGNFFIANNDDQGVMVKARFPLPGGCLP